MKTTWIPALMAATVACASAAAKQGPDVAVYFHHGLENAAIVGLAEGEAKRMLGSVGISVAWRLGKPHREGSAEVIEAVLVEQPDATFRPGALAFAKLGVETGTRVEIFYNRVRGSHADCAVPSILAHVLVHEITHVLEGVNRHSESGVMKAYWDISDFDRMRTTPLPFADEDIRLIQAWSERHNRTQVAGLR